MKPYHDIMKQIHETRRHVQAALTPSQYAAFRAAAEQEGLTLQEAAREALIRWAHDVKGEDPFRRFIGRYQGHPDASSEIDADYEAD